MSWRCFHCDEVFIDEVAAADHFGPEPSSIPGCVMRLTASDAGLVVLIRDLEAEVRRLKLDIENETSSTDAYRARLRGELQGFLAFRGCRSVQDAFNVYDTMEGRALAAEHRLARLGEIER